MVAGWVATLNPCATESSQSPEISQRYPFGIPDPTSAEIPRDIYHITKPRGFRMAANSIRYLSARLAGSGRPRRFSSGVKSLEFDYVVVGAGSAGSCIAFRLAEAGNSVAVLEAGPHDIWHPASIFLHMPTALSIPMNMDSFNWGYMSEPEPYLGNRRMHCPR
eukprot:1338215-Amorphochlora_amoeboformis.AAC.1